MSELTITLVNSATGQSEVLPVAGSTKLSDLKEWSVALLGLASDASQILLFKDGRKLDPTSSSLDALGIKSGDLIAVEEERVRQQQRQQRQRQQQQQQRQTTSGAMMGLDFSSLLGQQQSAPPIQQPSTMPERRAPPVYYPGMSLDDAIAYNPHPRTFVELLLSKEHLFKEMRYHKPQLAAKLQNQSIDSATQIWQEEVVSGSIARAVQMAEATQKLQEMNRRLQQNPEDKEAKDFFRGIESQKKVDEQYYQMMEEFPEALGRVLMLYVEAKINGHPIQAFCDSGAQMTIMSRKVAIQCGLEDYIDKRFAGVAAGVGTGKILGRIHIVQLQIGNSFFPCSVSVMDDPAPGATEMPFLLGLDMMKRHLCQIDLQKGVLRFTSDGTEVPFLHEKDLDVTKGGTRGFDAEKANQELEQQKMDKD